MQFISVNKDNTITGVSNKKFENTEQRVIEIAPTTEHLIGRKIGVKSPSKMKVAIICNWLDTCGISTYSKYLVDSLTPKVSELKIFSEVREDTKDDGSNVVRCWIRGESMRPTIELIKQWQPDFVIIQHEYGIFPKASFFLQMLHMLEHIPYAVVLHSVYEHLDKTICSSAIKNIIVHSNEGKDILLKMGHNNNIHVIPHGCVKFDNINELWNIFQTPYCIVQFGFGFFYKGVDRAIEAVSLLKQQDKKFENIFYCYLCSDNAKCNLIHDQYQDYLNEKIDKLGLHDNVAIVRKYHTDAIINNYLRTAKLALFPYLTDPNNTVYGASGAIRVAMANGTPVIASESHLFDDLENVIPRPNNIIDLAHEIDKIFSDEVYKKNILDKSRKHIDENDWDISANRYLEIIKKIIDKEDRFCLEATLL